MTEEKKDIEIRLGSAVHGNTAIIEVYGHTVDGYPKFETEDIPK